MALDPDLVGQAFNFSNEIQLDVLALTTKILSLMGRDDLVPTVLPQPSNEIKHQYLSAEKARNLMNWQPVFSLDQGLRNTIDWYSKFLKA